VGKKLKAELGVKFLFDMRGLWANEKVDAGAWNLNNPIFKMVYNYFKKQEKLFFEQADYSISLTEAGKKEIHSWSHIQNNPVPIQVIPCCADLDHFDRAKVSEANLNQLRDQLKIKPGEVVISYLGGIGTWYMLDEMLDFFLVFKEAVPSAKFLFITGDEHDSIVNKALQKGIGREELVLKKASRQEVPLCLALSNYALFFIRPTYSKLASSPTKQGEIMAMGIPLVCNSGVGDTDGIVTNYQSGIVNQVIALEGYQESIKKLLSTPFSPAHLRAGALNYFNLAEGVARYAWVYNQIMD
jgi:glycosyltransferase involved in cell wall biosynthesis